MAYLSNVARYEGDPRVLRAGPSAQSSGDRLARALGWFSIGLGMGELIAPHVFTRALGMEGRETLVRAFGVREMGAGAVSLSTEKDLGLWSRVGGDVLDLAMLALALRRDNPKRRNAALALAVVAGIGALDVVAAQQERPRRRSQGDRDKYRDRSGFPHGVEKARGAARDAAAAARPSDKVVA